MVVTHVIFDMDGTLVDSESLLFEAIDRLSVSFGLEANKQVKFKLLGHPFAERALQLYSDLRFEGILSFKTFVQKLIQDCRANVTQHGMRLMPGAQRLVDHFARHHIPMAIATGNDRQSYEETAQRFHPFFSAFSHAVLSGDKSEGIPPKPSPHIYATAFSRFSPPPESPANCLVFEDTEVGVLAAVSAGMKCVFVVDERLNEVRDWKVADHVITSLDLFRPEEWALPALQSTRAE